MSKKEIKAIIDEKQIAPDNSAILGQHNKQAYKLPKTQHYESLDYEEFYGPDAYLDTWHPLITEEQLVREASLSSVIKKFARNKLNAKWERPEKQIVSRSSHPLGEFLRGSFILRIARPFSSLISQHRG